MDKRKALRGIFRMLNNGAKWDVVSRPIEEAAALRPNLNAITREGSPLFRARDLAAHNGHEHWHRELDARVVNHITANREMTTDGFWKYLRNLYQGSDLQSRFPSQNWGPWIQR